MTEHTPLPWRITHEAIGLGVSVGVTGTHEDVTYFLTGSDLGGNAKTDAEYIVKAASAYPLASKLAAALEEMMLVINENSWVYDQHLNTYYCPSCEGEKPHHHTTECNEGTCVGDVDRCHLMSAYVSSMQALALWHAGEPEGTAISLMCRESRHLKCIGGCNCDCHDYDGKPALRKPTSEPATEAVRPLCQCGHSMFFHDGERVLGHKDWACRTCACNAFQPATANEEASDG